MRRATTNSPLLVTLSFLAVAVASCAQVEADVPEAKVTQKSVTFQGVLGGMWKGGETSTTQFFTLSSAELSWMKDLNSKVCVSAVDLKVVSGVKDLSFIHYGHIAIANGDVMGLPIEIADYVRPEDAEPSVELTARHVPPADISKIWTAKKVVVSVAVAGDLPQKPWSVDVTLHLSGKIAYKL
jgi:hypothetical protein